MMRTVIGLSLLAMAIAALPACSKCGGPDELRSYSLDHIAKVITRNNVTIDEEVKVEGKGALRISAPVPTIVRLFETGEIDVENSRLVYKAKLRSEDMKGKAYLEMLVDFPDDSVYFSRGLERALVGTTEWTSESIPFALEKGQNPENIKLNLVIDGTGTVWVDDVKLIKSPL